MSINTIVKRLAIGTILVIVSSYVIHSNPDNVRAQSIGSSISQKNNDEIIKHFHVSLNITVDDKPLIVPAKIGMDPPLWKYHGLDKYGMQSMDMTMPGMAPLHTHDTSGTIHVETSIKRNYTLGEFLDTWDGLEYSGDAVKATVDGQAISDFRNHVLKEKEHIILEY